MSPLKAFLSYRTRTQRIVNGIRTVWEFLYFFTAQSKEEPAPLLPENEILFVGLFNIIENICEHLMIFRR